MSLRASSTRVRRRALRLSHHSGLASIRFATVLGCIFAFALLCVISIRANAASLTEDTPHLSSLEAVQPAAPLGARDALAQDEQARRATRVRDRSPEDASSIHDHGDKRSELNQSDATEHISKVDQQAWLFELAAPAVVALAGACLSRAALKRVVEKNELVVDEWARKCEAAEARAEAARSAASTVARIAESRERLRLLGVTRAYTEAPLTAIVSLLESAEMAGTASDQRVELRVIQCAVNTWRQTLHDILDASPLASRSFVFDESDTNVRDVVQGVIALLTPSAEQRGLRLNSNVDEKVADWVIADSARLGQMFFHLLNRAIVAGTNGDVAIVVRAVPLNLGSQRISLEVVKGGNETLQPSQRSLFDAESDQFHVDNSPDEVDTCLPLCRLLVQRMRGELSVGSATQAGTTASFSASFPIGRMNGAETESRNSRAPLFAATAQSQVGTENAPSEPFERSYLHALAEEGINLDTFLNGWRHSMDDDLKQLNTLNEQHNIDGQRSALHRLSGAVSLVGARSLMEALRLASVAPLDDGAETIGPLVTRARTLISQLDASIESERSTVQ